MCIEEFVIQEINQELDSMINALKNRNNYLKEFEVTSCNGRTYKVTYVDEANSSKCNQCAKLTQEAYALKINYKGNTRTIHISTIHLLKEHSSIIPESTLETLKKFFMQ